jgi:hypothetical protein
MSLNYQSSWYHLFFPKRDRVIRDYLTALKTQWAAWATRLEHDSLSSPTPNGIQILLDVGAANLSPRALRDVCWRIIDEVKIPSETHNLATPEPVRVSVPSWADPNPLYPTLKDEDLLPFLRHCKKNKLCITPLYNASFEASLFLSRHKPAPTIIPHKLVNIVTD